MQPPPALDSFQQRHRWLGLPIAILYKYVDDQGGYLAALITYYGFVSLFPLLLLAVTILGFVLHGDPQLQQRILGSALSQFPIIGKQIQTNLHSYRGSGVALVVGILGTLYGGLGVAQAGHHAMNSVWAVPRNERANPIKARVQSLALLGTLGLGVLATTALSALTTGADSFANSFHLGVLTRLFAFGLALALNVGLFIAAFRLLTDRAVAIHDILTGAVAAALAWQVLQAVGTYFVAHRLKGASEIYGTFGIVLGLLAWIYLEAVIVVLCAELNVVVRRHLWPRALLAPFIEGAELTEADEQAYTSYVRAQRRKGFQHIDVRFGDQEPEPARAARDTDQPVHQRSPRAD